MNQKINEDWPRSGGIDLKDIKMRYRPNTELALKGMHVKIKGGQRIGVVGRSGAGKSSLMNILTRFCYYEKGQIEIDGVDISSINLTKLRQAITIIPQDPTLFKGTLRYNIDPRSEYTDS